MAVVAPSLPVATEIFIYIAPLSSPEQRAQWVDDSVHMVAKKNWKTRREGFYFIFLAGFTLLEGKSMLLLVFLYCLGVYLKIC
jgi:hypothetical protein